MSSKRVELQIPKDLYEKLDDSKNEKGFADIQDLIYDLLREQYEDEKTLFEKLKGFFK